MVLNLGSLDLINGLAEILSSSIQKSGARIQRVDKAVGAVTLITAHASESAYLPVCNTD